MRTMLLGLRVKCARWEFGCELFNLNRINHGLNSVIQH